MNTAACVAVRTPGKKGRPPRGDVPASEAQKHNFFSSGNIFNIQKVLCHDSSNKVSSSGEHIPNGVPNSGLAKKYTKRH